MKTAKAPLFQQRDVETLFKSYDQSTRKQLLKLRHLIFDTARETDGVGALQETLKWGQASYLTAETKSGSTIRMDAIKGADKTALYFHCQTTLVPTFRDMYGDKLNFEGNRAIILNTGAPLPEAELRHCISLALTYHLAKKKRRT